MKKVLVVGCGLDVLDKERGEFIDSYFDDVIIMKHAVLFINEFKKYTGNPTILLPPHREWRKYELFAQLKKNKREEAKEWYSNERLEPIRKRICKCIYNSCITRLILFPMHIEYYHPFNFPLYNIYNKDIAIVDTTGVNVFIHTQGTSAGIVALKYAIQNYDKVYYMGFDGEARAYTTKDKNGKDILYTHYYNKYGRFTLPWNSTLSTSNYDQYFDIKMLEKKYGISHIDNIHK